MPFKSFGRVNGGKGQSAFIRRLCGGERAFDSVAGGLDGHVGEKRLEIAVAFHDRKELFQIPFPLWIIVEPVTQYGLIVLDDMFTQAGDGHVFRVESRKKGLQFFYGFGYGRFQLQVLQPPVPGARVPQVTEKPGSSLGPYFFQQQQDAVPTDTVVGVVDNLQMGQHILDMGGIHEFEPAHFDKRNTLSAQLDFEIK